MAEFISIKADVEPIKELFQEVASKSKYLQKNILTALGNKAKSTLKKKYSLNLKKGSENLYKSINKYVSKKGDSVSIYSPAKKDGVRYGFVLSKGATIKAKGDGYLTFKIDGKWIKAKSITIKGKDWVEAPVRSFIDSSEYGKTIDAVITKEVDKLFKKGILQ